ncbi:hypothetical protein NM688_g7762 [Phlebia brevispora]|uniref:Uncharacterized protein n=1 Tax=Phlebia brevispora TaxID=194682 RepID=A0ACC1S1J1_9APHY|nr:hypothetical protein NM688_g7762 [Phlebia brevispora]
MKPSLNYATPSSTSSADRPNQWLVPIGSAPLCLTYQVHWGNSLTDDPSKLGHSATRIGQKGLANLKKVDYYPAAYLAYIVLDARMLDCWQIFFGCVDLVEYFAALEASNALPTLDALSDMARALYFRYSSRQAYLRALRGDLNEDWGVQSGSTWTPPHQCHRASDKPKARTSKLKGYTAEALEEDFKGDQALAHSILFMHDTIISREIALAVPEGDIGHVYEELKVSITPLDMQSPARYTSYGFEQQCQLEYEFTEPLRELFLENWIINPSGLPGGYKAGDHHMHLERHNLELQNQMTRRDIEWDSTLSRQVVSPNIDKLIEIKNTFSRRRWLSEAT